MLLRLLLSALHLIALGIGLGAVIARGTSLRDLPEPGALRRAFVFDAMWGIAALLWLATGLWRLFGETEKSVGYYMANHAFFGKMGLFLVVLALEIWPMVMLIRWRMAIARGADAGTIADPATGRRIAMISHIQALLVMLIVFAAVAMARGVGVVP